jgi:hypothetical protein
MFGYYLQNRIFRIPLRMEAEVGDAIKQRPNTFPRIMAKTQEEF